MLNSAHNGNCHILFQQPIHTISLCLMNMCAGASMLKHAPGHAAAALGLFAAASSVTSTSVPASLLPLFSDSSYPYHHQRQQQQQQQYQQEQHRRLSHVHAPTQQQQQEKYPQENLYPGQNHPQQQQQQQGEESGNLQQRRAHTQRDPVIGSSPPEGLANRTYTVDPAEAGSPGDVAARVAKASFLLLTFIYSLTSLLGLSGVCVCVCACVCVCVR